MSIQLTAALDVTKGSGGTDSRALYLFKFGAFTFLGLTVCEQGGEPRSMGSHLLFESRLEHSDERVQF